MWNNVGLKPLHCHYEVFPTSQDNEWLKITTCNHLKILKILFLPKYKDFTYIHIVVVEKFQQKINSSPTCFFKCCRIDKPENEKYENYILLLENKGEFILKMNSLRFKDQPGAVSCIYLNTNPDFRWLIFNLKS